MINFDRDQIVMSIPNPKQQSCQSYHFQIGFLFVKIGSIKSKFYIKDFFDKIFFVELEEGKVLMFAKMQFLKLESKPHFYRLYLIVYC